MEPPRALLVANWEYRGEARFEPLRSLEDDLAAIERALTDERFGAFRGSVRTRLNLTNADLSREIEQFMEAAGRSGGSPVLIYYAGHGELTAGSTLALCGVDTESANRAFDTYVLGSWVRELARGAPTLLILDCCYAGAFRGGQVAVGPALLRDPDGFLMLGSTGNTPVLDSSVFARALAEILVDPNIPGVQGVLTPSQVHEQLTTRLTDAYRPTLKGELAGMFRLARRPLAATPATLAGWREDELRAVELRITAEGATASWDDQRCAHRFDRFDRERRWAIHRLLEMVDGVVRQRPPDDDDDWRPAVRDAWQCIRTNLFETALPPALRSLLSDAGDARHTLLQLRLAFDDAADHDLLPWEHLATGRSGVLVQRAAPPPEPRGASEPLNDAIVVNAFRSDLGRTGARIRDDLHRIWPERTVRYLGPEEATWINFLEAVDDPARYLVLVMPLSRRLEGGGKVTMVEFVQPSDPTEVDSHGADELLARLADRASRFDCVVLVTYAAEPGRDCYRAILDLARQVSHAGHAPLAFVCHEPAYQAYLDAQPRAETFAGLLLRALQQQHPVERSFVWARNRVMERAGQAKQHSFGVPGLYAHDAGDAGQQTGAARVAESPSRAEVGTPGRGRAK